MRRALAVFLLFATTARADLVLDQDGGIVGNVTILNVVGPTCAVSRSGSVGTLTCTAGGAGGASGFNVWDEWVDAGNVTGMNCVGDSITCTKLGATANIYVDAGKTAPLVGNAPVGIYWDGGVNGIYVAGLSGTNTGDQTKTCSAGYAITTLAAGTSSVCSLMSTGTVTDVTATSPIVSSGGPTPNLTLLCAGVGQSGGACVNGSTLQFDGGGTFTGPLAASNLSGTNTGDQTKTCSAGQFLSQLAAGTSSTCTTPASGVLTDGGTLTVEELTGLAPIQFYDDGGVIAGSCPTCASGSWTLSGGTTAKTVPTGTTCVCGLTTGTVWPKCSLSGTTLTITGTGTDTGTYVCM